MKDVMYVARCMSSSVSFLFLFRWMHYVMGRIWEWVDFSRFLALFVYFFKWQHVFYLRDYCCCFLLDSGSGGGWVVVSRLKVENYWVYNMHIMCKVSSVSISQTLLDAVFTDILLGYQVWEVVTSVLVE